VGKIGKKKQFEGVRFLLIRHSRYSVMVSKIHSYRLPTGKVNSRIALLIKLIRSKL